MISKQLGIFFSIIPSIILIEITITKKQIYTESAKRYQKFLINPGTVSFPFSYPTINICLGSPEKQCLDMLIDTLYFVDWIECDNPKYGSYYQSNISTTFKYDSNEYEAYHFDNNQLRGIQARDLLYINQEPVSTIPGYSFFAIDSNFRDSMNVNGVVSLNRLSLFKETTKGFFTFFEHIYREKNFKKRVFGLIYNDPNAVEGKLVLGEDLDNYNKDNVIKMDLYKNEKIPFLSRYWSILLAKIRINAKTDEASYSINAPAIIKTGYQYIKLPDRFSTILKYYSQKAKSFAKNCSVEQLKEIKLMICDPFDIRKMNTIELYFKGGILNLYPENLFVISEQFPGKIEFVIRTAAVLENVIIGNALLRSYNIFFDIDNEQMFFQDIKPHKNNEMYGENNNTILIISLLTTLILTLCCLYLVLIQTGKLVNKVI